MLLRGSPANRDLIVLTAFSVVLGTLVIQGLTLKPLLRALDLHDDDPVGRELSAARERRAATMRFIVWKRNWTGSKWQVVDRRSNMRIGILGSGLMGGKLGTIITRAGHEVIFSYARSKEKLKKLARNAKGKARPGTPREAAQEADAVLLAVHWSRIGDVLNQTGDLSGKVILTCSLPMNDENTELVIAHTSSGSGCLRIQHSTQ